MLIDTHAHLLMGPMAGDPAGVLERARAAGVQGVVTVAIDLESSHRSVELAQAHRGLWATVGIHPHELAGVDGAALDNLEELARREEVVAWGEIGLDFAKEYHPRGKQERLFREQLRRAQGLGLPVVIHARDAVDRALSVVLEEGVPPGKAVFHCFSGDVEQARRVVEAGYLASVTGIVTFPKAHTLRRVVAELPLERIMLETDAPFLSPVPFRGRPNEPARLVHVAQAVAEVKGVEMEEVARWTTANARAFFGLSLP